MNTLQKAAVATRYYESLRANIVQGWEKYVLTDGEHCMFVNRCYQPAAGEAVFHLATRSRQTMCQLVSVSEAEQYTLAPAIESAVWWAVRDNIHSISITFAEGLFNATQRVETDLHLTKVEAEALPSHLRRLGDWIVKHHSAIAFCDKDAMKAAVSTLNEEGYWILLADALNRHVRNPQIPATAELSAEIEDYLSDNPDNDLISEYEVNPGTLTAAVHTLSDAAAQEVFRTVSAFWESGRDIVDWANDIVYWPAIRLEGGEDIEE